MLGEHLLNVTQTLDHMVLINDLMSVLDCISGPLTRGDRVVSCIGASDLP